MGSESILKKKNFDFAVRIIKLCKYLRENHREYDLSQQLLRSGTSIGAIIREAEHGESKKDFLHKLTIGLKEANECAYWLELLTMSGYITMRMFESIKTDCDELLKMLIASIKTIKNRIKSSM